MDRVLLRLGVIALVAVVCLPWLNVPLVQGTRVTRSVGSCLYSRNGSVILRGDIRVTYEDAVTLDTAFNFSIVHDVFINESMGASRFGIKDFWVDGIYRCDGEGNPTTDEMAGHHDRMNFALFTQTAVANYTAYNFVWAQNLVISVPTGAFVRWGETVYVNDTLVNNYTSGPADTSLTIWPAATAPIPFVGIFAAVSVVVVATAVGLALWRRRVASRERAAD